MRRLGKNLRRSSAGGRRARRGYSLLELAVALGVFLLLASVVSLAVAQAVSSQSNLRTQRAVSNALDAVLQDLSKTSYDSLLSNTFTPPDLCEGEAKGAGDSTHTCLRLGSQGYQVAYVLTVGEDFIDVNAAVTLKNGDVVEQTRRVKSPYSGYQPGTGVVRLTLTGEWQKLKGPVYLLRQDGSTGATGKPSSEGVVLLRAPVSTCTSAAPCSLSLAPDGSASTGGLGLVTPDSSDVGIVLNAGGLLEASGRVFVTGKATVSLIAQSDTPGISGAATPAGSVCLWGTFMDGVQQRTVPLCNTGTDPGVIEVSTYAPDPRYPEVTRPIPTDSKITLAVDRKDGTCPYAPGMVGSTASGWVQAAVCTSWTWGVPSRFGQVGGPDSAFDSASITLVSGGDDKYRAVWSGDLARPAAGYNSEPVWAKPRQAAGCAFDGTCVSFGNTVPEDTECPGKHCLSAANFLPELTGPLSGENKVATVAVGAGSTAFDLSAVDRDEEPLRIVLKSAPGVGTLHLANSAGDLAAGTELGSGSGSVTVPLVYEPPVGGVSLTSFVVTLSDSRGSRDVEVGLYGTNQTWKVEPKSAKVRQGGTALLEARAVATDGSPRSGVSLSFELPSGVSAASTTATTGTDGIARLEVQVGAVGATTYQVKVTAQDSGRSADLPLTVTQAGGELGVVAIGAAQGGRGYVVASTKDLAGAALNGVAVNLAVLKDGVASSVVYPEYTGCVTRGDGECEVALIVEKGAPAGEYQVVASSGDFSATATVTVTSAVASITAPAIEVFQGQSTTVSFTVLDGAGAPVGGSTLNVSAPKGDLQVEPASAITAADGTASIKITAPAGTVAGSTELVAAAGGFSVRIPVEVLQSAAALQAGPEGTVAQGGETSIWVTVLDSQGSPMAGVTVLFSAPAGSGLEVSSRATSGADGRATAGVVANPGDAGTHQITATSGAASTTVPVVVQPVLGSVSTQGGAGQTGSFPVTFVLTDLNGEPLAGKTAMVTSTNTTITVDTPQPSDAAGNLAATVTTASTPTGTYQLQVTVDGTSVPALLVVS